MFQHLPDRLEVASKWRAPPVITKGSHTHIALSRFLVEQGDCMASVGIAVQLCTAVSKVLEMSKRNRWLPSAIGNV